MFLRGVLVRQRVNGDALRTVSELPDNGMNERRRRLSDERLDETILRSLCTVDEIDLRASLARLTQWLDRQNAQRQREIVTYITNEELAGRGHLIKAYTIAVDIFGKDEDFDPASNSLVRVEMHRLRSSLDRFYKLGSLGAPIAFVLPPGKYRLMVKPNDIGVDFPNDIAENHADSAVQRSEPRNEQPEIEAAIDIDANVETQPVNIINGWFHFLKRNIVLITTFITLCMTVALLWYRESGVAAPPTVEDLAPSLAIDVEANDKNLNNLNEIAKLLRAKLPIRFPVSISVDSNADYILHLSSFLDSNGVEMVETILYDKERDLVFTESQPANDLNNLTQRAKISETIHDHFLSIEGYLSKDFDHNQNYPQERRRLYACYRTLNLVIIGRSISPPDIDKNLNCLNPDLVAEPKDKVLIYILRSSVIALSASGIVKTTKRYSLDDARKELDVADTLYPDEQAILGQRIVLEWRDPHHDNQKLSALLAAAEKGVMTAELRYNVAISYVYYLGNFEAGKRVANDNSVVQQGLRQSMGDLYYFVEVPEFLIAKDYDAARNAVKKTGAKSAPTYALLMAATACGRGDPKDIAASLELVRENQALDAQSLKQYLRNRHYAPVVENALIEALSSPSCLNQVG